MSIPKKDTENTNIIGGMTADIMENSKHIETMGRTKSENMRKNVDGKENEIYLMPIGVRWKVL